MTESSTASRLSRVAISSKENTLRALRDALKELTGMQCENPQKLQPGVYIFTCKDKDFKGCEVQLVVKKAREDEGPIHQLLSANPSTTGFVVKCALADGGNIIITKYMTNGDLLDWKNSTMMPENTNQQLVQNNILKLTVRLSKSIAALHRLSIVHRDIALENYFVDEDGKPWLGDFGLATHATRVSSSALVYCGKITYCAPELQNDAQGAELRKQGYDLRVADVFSLGMLFLVLLYRDPTVLSQGYRSNAFRLLQGAFDRGEAEEHMRGLCGFRLPDGLVLLLKKMVDSEWKKRPRIDEVTRICDQLALKFTRG